MRLRGTTGKSEPLASTCMACSNEVDVHVASGVVEGPGHCRGPITYADTDIVVWDCPSCGAANADTVTAEL